MLNYNKLQVNFYIDHNAFYYSRIMSVGNVTHLSLFLIAFFYLWLWKESLNSDDQQFQQYQLSEPCFTLNNWTQKTPQYMTLKTQKTPQYMTLKTQKNTTIYDIGNTKNTTIYDIENTKSTLYTYVSFLGVFCFVFF
jgi:hypothetical protein